MSNKSIDYSKLGIAGLLLALGYAGWKKINESPAVHLAEGNQLSRDESLELATYITLKEASDKGHAGMGLLGKLSRIPGFDRSAIGIFKGQIKEVADLRNHEPELAANLLADLEAKVDVSLLDSLYLSPELKDYINMISHAKLYRAFKEGLDDERIFIWKMVLLPIIEARSEEIYGKRATILNGFLDNPADIFDDVYLKYTPFTPDSIEEIEGKLNEWGIPLNFPHTPDDLKDVDIESGKIDDTSDKVVVRFAPTPNGPLSIGHSRGVCLLGEYQKRYPGAKLLLRFDDTDPAKSTNLSEYGIENVFDRIIDEMNWLLDIELPDEDIIVASKRFEIYQNAVKNAISEGKAVCDTKDEGIIKGEEANLKVYEDMFAGKYGAGEAAIKLKSTIPKDSLNKSYAERKGEVLYRMVKHKGENLCVPLMNLQSVVDDKLYKVTHIVRGADHDRSNLGRQKQIWADLGYGPFPYDDNWGLVALTDDQKYQTYVTKSEFSEKSDEVDETLDKKEGKIGIKTTRISTSRMRKGMDEGLYQENKFDSPELPTLTSLRHEHQLIEGARPILASAIRAYWNIKRANQDETAIFNRDEMRELSRHILDEGYIFEEREYDDERERQEYIKKLKVSDKYYAEDEDNIIVHWPESQKWMEHPEANLIMSDDEPAMYSVPKSVIEEHPDGYYGAESFGAESAAERKKRLKERLEQIKDAPICDCCAEPIIDGKCDCDTGYCENANCKNAADSVYSKINWAESFSADTKQCSVCGDLAVHVLKKGEIVLCDKHYQQQFGKYSRNAESFEADGCNHRWEVDDENMEPFFRRGNLWVMARCRVICADCGRIWHTSKEWIAMNRRFMSESFETKHEKRGKVRTMSGKPHKPRKLVRDKNIRPEEAGKRTHLRAEGDKTCLMSGQVIPANKTYASADLARLATQKVSLFGGGGGYQRADLAKAVMVLKKSNMELSAAEWAERIKGSSNYRTNKELTPFNINSILKYLKPDVISKRATRGGIKSKGYVYRLVKGNCLMDWIRPDYLPQEVTEKKKLSESFSVEGKSTPLKPVKVTMLEVAEDDDDVYVVTYATVGNAKGNLIPIDNLLFDVVKGENKAYKGMALAVEDVIIEDFVKERTSKGYSGDILDAQIDAFLMDKGIRPFNKNRFKTFMQTNEWESYFSKSGGFLWFTVTPLKDYLKKESPSWIYVPFS